MEYKTIKNFVDELEKNDIETIFSTFIVGVGQYYFGPKNLVKILKDKKKFTFDLLNVTPELYREWELWLEDQCQCVAITKKGHRCKNVGVGLMYNPGSFIKGVSDRCKTHQDNTGA